MCWLLLVAVSLALAALGEAYTAPDELRKLMALRAELMKPERGVADKLSSWRCPTDLFGNCDPCGAYSGNDAAFGDDGGGWAHVACRKYDISARETSAEILGIYFARSSQPSPGLVTNIHITDLGIKGTLESMGPVLCPLVHLRELDLDGAAFTGGIPGWLSSCFPKLKELDLSFNQLTGSLPPWIDKIGGGGLLQFKAEHNSLTGAIPLHLGNSNLKVLWLFGNDLQGMLPQDLARSDSLISLDVRDNRHLCGPLPPGLHVNAVPEDWKGFCAKASSEDSACEVLTSRGTGLGSPCK